MEEKEAGNEAILAAYCKRLKEVAGFKYVPKPLPMYNSLDRIIYYLVFASQNSTGSKIAEHIFDKYRNRRAGK